MKEDWGWEEEGGVAFWFKKYQQRVAWLPVIHAS